MASEGEKGRIVFMGSPDFAVASAEALYRAGYHFAAVVTVPDRPAGRGLRLRESPVKRWAQDHDLPVLQPEDLHDPEFLDSLRNYAADAFVVVAFRILPREIFTLPPRGTINLHASLLPKYRGAAPINWAIIEGERETGLTTFLIDEKVDTGDILLQRTLKIGEDETFGELYDRMKRLGSELLVETLDRWLAGEIRPRRQIGTPTRAPKIKPEMCRIDWSQPAARIHNLIRGLSPVPAAFTSWNGRRLKIFRSRPLSTGDAGEAGTVLEADARSGVLSVQAGEGAVQLLELQPEGKRPMQAAEFLRGYKIEPGDVFGAD